MTLTKTDLVNSVYKTHTISKNEAVEVVETLLETMKGCLDRGEDLLVSGFGKFKVKKKRARRGRNPQTGEELILAPRSVVTFRPSGILRSLINGGGKWQR